MSEESGPPPVKLEDIAEMAASSFIAGEYFWGLRHLRKCRWAKAVSAFEKSISAYRVIDELGAPDDIPRSRVFYNLGLALEQLPNLEKSIQALEKAISTDPGNMPAREALARVAIDHSDYDRAIHEYNEAYLFVEGNLEKFGAIEIDKVRCEILTHLGSLLARMDQPAEAEGFLSQAISIRPDDPRALARYAVVAGSQGRKFELKKYLSAALDKIRPGMDDDLISSLLQDAAYADYGDTILDMLAFRQLIKNGVFEQQKQARQRVWNELRRNSPNVITNGGTVVFNPDNVNSNNGAAGTVGNNGTNYGKVQQFNPTASELNADMHTLAAELEQLRERLRSEANEYEKFRAAEEIEEARKAAEISDRTTLIIHLKAAGQWALEVATKVGVSAAEAALRKALSLP